MSVIDSSILPYLGLQVKTRSSVFTSTPQNWFLSLLDTTPQDLVGYCRVSTPRQNLQSQVAKLAFDVWWDSRIGRKSARLVKVFSEVHTGTTLDRKSFGEALAYCRTHNLPMVAPDINRLVRHPDYGQFVRTGRVFPEPTPDQLRELLSLGVQFVLALPLDTPQSEIRSAETKRGKLRPGRVAIPLDHNLLQRIRWLKEIGATCRQIEEDTGISKSRVANILKACPKTLVQDSV